MKVLKKVDVSNWSYKHHCKTCDSDLEIESKDLKYYYYSGDQREPQYSATESFSCACAVCSTTINIPKADIPKLLQIEAKARSNSSNNYRER